MPAKKKSVNTPLHLLEQLANTLVDHLDKACQLALQDAEGTLGKLEKQRGKAQERLAKARTRLDEAGRAGRAKAQGKARTRIAELEELMALLQARQGEMLGYIAELKRDIAQSLHLAQGVRQVGDSAAQALQTRNSSAETAATSANARKPAARSSRAPAAAAKPATTRARPAKAPASKPAAKVEPEAAAPAAKPARSRPVASKPAVTSTPAATPKPATKKPVARKPAKSSGATTQAPRSSS